MNDMSRLFRRAADEAAKYRESLTDRPVGVPPGSFQPTFGSPLQAGPTHPPKGCQRRKRGKG
ncbi:MAG TPA: hypothetical protein DGT23_16170, partial [Micromonosporaceae bacterium]|nr:hypothetical protein [Micromonosporaceae bacterium]